MAHARLFTDTREIKMQTKNESFSIAELCEGYVNNYTIYTIDKGRLKPPFCFFHQIQYMQHL